MPIELDQLSAEERLALIGQLWDSLDDADLAVTPAHQAEIDRRLEEDSGAISWEVLRQELRQRLR